MQLKVLPEQMVDVVMLYEQSDREVYLERCRKHMTSVRRNPSTRYHEICVGEDSQADAIPILQEAEVVVVLVSRNLLSWAQSLELLKRMGQLSESGALFFLLMLDEEAVHVQLPAVPAAIFPQEGRPLSQAQDVEGAWFKVTHDLRKEIEKLILLGPGAYAQHQNVDRFQEQYQSFRTRTLVQRGLDMGRVLDTGMHTAPRLTALRVPDDEPELEPEPEPTVEPAKPYLGPPEPPLTALRVPDDEPPEPTVEPAKPYLGPPEPPAPPREDTPNEEPDEGDELPPGPPPARWPLLAGLIFAVLLGLASLLLGLYSLGELADYAKRDRDAGNLPEQDLGLVVVQDAGQPEGDIPTDVPDQGEARHAWTLEMALEACLRGKTCKPSVCAESLPEIECRRRALDYLLKEHRKEPVFTGLNLANLSLQRLNLEGLDLRGSDLSHTRLQEARLGGANLQRCRAEEACVGEDRRTRLDHADLTRADLKGALLQGASLRYAKLEMVDLVEAKLQGADLLKANLFQADLTKARFDSSTRLSDTNLKQARVLAVDFRGVKLDGADWEGAVENQDTRWPAGKPPKGLRQVLNFEDLTLTEEPRVILKDLNLVSVGFSRMKLNEQSFVSLTLPQAQFLKVEARGASFCGAQMPGATFEMVELDRADFSSGCNGDLAPKRCPARRTVLTTARFEQVSLRRANFSCANLLNAQFLSPTGDTNPAKPEDIQTSLHRALFVGALLQGAEFSPGLDLTGADFTKARLKGARLRGTTLREAIFQGADLSDVDLSGADLSGADLSGANLTGVDVSGADLTGAKLKGAVLKQVRQDAGTRWTSEQAHPKPSPPREESQGQEAREKEEPPMQDYKRQFNR